MAKGILILLLPLFWSCAPRERPPLLPEDVTQWTQLNQIPMDYPVPGHENQYRVTYINDRGLSPQMSDQGLVYPEGTIIAKVIHETLEADSAEVAITAMIKDSLSDDSKEGWVWVMKDLATNQERIINSTMCVTCHQSANEPHPYGEGNPQGLFRDYAFFYPNP